MIIGNIDKQLLLTLNSFVGSNDLHNAIIVGIGNNPLFRGFPIFFAVVALWFSDDCSQQRGRMLVGLLAACFATLLSYWLQSYVTLHIRPLLDPALDIKVADPRWVENWRHQGSFPSDTATLFFALVAVVALERWRVGGLCFLWALVTVGITRVALGYHYPSDIVGSLVLGPGCVYLFNQIPHLLTLFESAIKLFGTRVYIVHSLLFIFLADAYNLFPGLQDIRRGLLWIAGGFLN